MCFLAAEGFLGRGIGWGQADWPTGVRPPPLSGLISDRATKVELLWPLDELGGHVREEAPTVQNSQPTVSPFERNATTLIDDQAVSDSICDATSSVSTSVACVVSTQATR